jgi:hypothetical protein
VHVGKTPHFIHTLALVHLGKTTKDLATPLAKANNWWCELHLGKTFGYAFGLIEQLVVGATPWL